MKWVVRAKIKEKPYKNWTMSAIIDADNPFDAKKEFEQKYKEKVFEIERR